VAKYAKVIIASAVVTLLSLLLAWAEAPLVGVGVFVVGMLGVAVLHQRQADAGGPAPDEGKTKLDRALEDRGAAPPASGPAPAAPAAAPGGGLPTWSPTARPADPFAPPETAGGEPAAAAPPTDIAPLAERPARGSAWHAWQELDSGPAEDFDEDNPLADLDRLDEIDPIAEVERLEGISSSAAVMTSPGDFSFSSAPTPINEAAVKSSDDIMAASQATELNVAEGEDSELARLLAKVQQRLAAYE
jgi:hypothetical protein